MCEQGKKKEKEKRQEIQTSEKRRWSFASQERIYYKKKNLNNDTHAEFRNRQESRHSFHPRTP